MPGCAHAVCDLGHITKQWGNPTQLWFRKTLKGRDREICELRTMAEQPLMLQEIGDRFGVTRERVRIKVAPNTVVHADDQNNKLIVEFAIHQSLMP